MTIFIKFSKRIIQDIKSTDSRVQIIGYIKDLIDDDHIILKDKSNDIKIDIKNVDFINQKEDLINVIGELNINVEGEKEIEAEIIQDKKNLNFDYYLKLYEIKKELKLI
ncbi:MAG: hypothetical protein ACTSO6_07260 [Promethearchaeota archaeon]